MIPEPSEELNFDAFSVETGYPDDDPLLCNVSLPLREVFHPLGFGVEIATNSRAVLDAALESWGHFAPRGEAPLLRLRVCVSEDGSDECPPTPVARAQRHLLSIVADGRNQVICDLKDGFACAWLNRSALRNASYLRYHFLEAAVLILISARHATPLHAACVSRHGRGVLLCGDSGIGKSSLAYACARSGWTYTCDDASFLLRGFDPPRVTGNHHQVRFRPSAKELFPELEGFSLTPRAEGKPSIEVPTSALPGIATAEEATIHSIVFLRRQDSAVAELAPVPAETALGWFHKWLALPGEIRQLQSASLQVLLSVNAYQLRYSDLARAVERLEGLTSRASERLK